METGPEMEWSVISFGVWVLNHRFFLPLFFPPITLYINNLASIKIYI